jgi:hypothetical protein
MIRQSRQTCRAKWICPSTMNHGVSLLVPVPHPILPLWFRISLLVEPPVRVSVPWAQHGHPAACWFPSLHGVEKSTLFDTCSRWILVHQTWCKGVIDSSSLSSSYCNCTPFPWLALASLLCLSGSQLHALHLASSMIANFAFLSLNH